MLSSIKQEPPDDFPESVLNYNCPHCAYKPNGPKRLARHVKCHYCGITFSDETLFILHQIPHSTGNPFKCSLCGTQCANKITFASHVLFSSH
ncbi:hypothetical protein CRE_21316 [Caenorhabditis remanei]|uniref:C2H2-type domain-containing protein n=1 Tax=Caenorhabditis remanei TaxID=31234 RepID=E3MUN7_CAERE|nr:hypothetical protein CRE_21316 [Caenorhabditis remanei]